MSLFPLVSSGQWAPLLSVVVLWLWEGITWLRRQMFVMGHSHTLKKQPSCKHLRLRLWWRGPEGGEPEAGLPSKGPCNRIQRLENGVRCNPGWGSFLLSGHAGAIPRLSIEMALFYGGRRFCMVWDLKRGQNLLISFGGEIEIECWHSGGGSCSLFDSCFFVTLSMLLLWDARMDGRSWFRDGLFACHLAKRACRLLVAPFCWSTLLFCSEALRITADY